MIFYLMMKFIKKQPMDGDFYYLTPKIKTIICHATDQLECLSLSKMWHVDGTFKNAS